MSTLKFSDGVNIDTSGPLRRLKLEDCLYVVGEGKLIPMNTEDEVSRYLKTEKVVDTIKKAKDPRKEFFNQISKILK